MGVPAFYGWLSKKYQLIVEDVKEVTELVGESISSPNGTFDNLYLDMNGIIHPCFHPEDSTSQPTSFLQVFESIFKYTDKIVSMIRPQNLLYMAIDGVAPRAKINQQRARRFCAARDRQTDEEEETRFRKELEEEGIRLHGQPETEVGDSNIITPGTVFMQKLSEALQGYITERLSKDPSWKKIKVILSDSSVVGEGEHKIMSFIRAQRAETGYNPDTRHCIYGLDADLIMLSLATHEVHFTVLRENVSNDPDDRVRKPYQLVRLWILRHYLELDMKLTDLPDGLKQVDVDRVIDDFIFLCLFVGNDFLPHMPSLDIHEGAIDLLMTVYKEEFKKLGGYIVDMEKATANTHRECRYLELKRVERYIAAVGIYEEKIFEKRVRLFDARLKRFLRDMDKANVDDDDGSFMETQTPRSTRLEGFLKDSTDLDANTKLLKEKLREMRTERSDLFRSDIGRDKVRFGERGWKERYYGMKMEVKNWDIKKIKKEMVTKYTEGLCWVLLYYYTGVPSWSWYYPYYYAPCASDMEGMSRTKICFSKGSPLKPLDQLMAVLPPPSAHALPASYQRLMTDGPPPVTAFYPDRFNTDVDGKRYKWQGITKLPFIECDLLVKETVKLELQDDEAARNSAGDDTLFVSGRRAERYALPPPSVHVPRALPGVTFPETTITENDIVREPLWHEQVRPSTGRPECPRPFHARGRASVPRGPLPFPTRPDHDWNPRPPSDFRPRPRTPNPRPVLHPRTPNLRPSPVDFRPRPHTPNVFPVLRPKTPDLGPSPPGFRPRPHTPNVFPVRPRAPSPDGSLSPYRPPPAGLQWRQVAQFQPQTVRRSSGASYDPSVMSWSAAVRGHGRTG